MKSLWLNLILCLIVACVGISMLMSKPVTYVKYTDDSVLVLRPSSLTDSGMVELGKLWRENPDFTTGIGVIIVLSFAGAVNAVRLIYLASEEEQDAPQSKSSEG